MTTLWLWLNSTELNWTLTVRDVDGNCFALCTHTHQSAPLSLSRALLLLLSLGLYLPLAISLSLVEISVQNFKFQCWVSQWLHTQTNTQTHVHKHTHTYSRIPIDSFQFCFRCPFRFVRERALGLSCVLSAVYSLLVVRVFSLSQHWFYLARSRVRSLSPSL